MNEHLEHFEPLPDELLGKMVLNKYRILKELARGGMGVVYLARVEGAEGFVRPVVVKRVLPQLASDSEYLGMFLREAQIMVNLKDQGVASVLDFAAEGGSYIMVLEYVRGYQVRQWLEFTEHKKRSIPTRVIVQIMINVLDALHAVHSAKDHLGSPLNIVHRDICPSNVLIDTEGHPKIVDFGIGVISSTRHRSFQTRAHKQFKGKLLYGAPELFENHPANPRTDVYAAAVMMHEMLVGDNEFLADSDGAVISRIMHHQPSHVYENREDATLALDQVVQKALEKDPASRYQTAAAFAEALRKLHPLSEREGAELIKESVGEDFGEEMARFIGEESLEERDQTWRNFEPGKVSIQRRGPEDTEHLPHDAATVVYTQLPARKARRLIPVLLALVLILGAVGWWVFYPTKGTEIYIVSGQNPSEDAVETPAATAESPPPEQPAQIPDPAPAQKTAPKRKAKSKAKAKAVKRPLVNSTPAQLGRVFSQKSPQMLQCMKQHLADVPSSAKIKVRLSIAQGGAVTSAEVFPKALASSAVGRCMEKVAETTVFPPQATPLTIRIPINVSLGSE